MTKNKKNRKKADRLWIGLLAGIIVFCAMIAVFLYNNGWVYNTYTNSWKWDDFSKVMGYLGKNSSAALQLAVLCILPNSMLAFLSYRLELWDTYKGFMVVTILSFVPFVLFLF